MKNKALTFKIPDSVIVVSPTINENHYKQIDELIVDFRTKLKRDWFVNHAYFCLPLTIANQYGFGVKSLHTFEAVWHGGNAPTDVEVNIIEPDTSGFQAVSSHFGMGTVTVQNHMVWQTPEFINLLTTNPPNMFKDAITNMNGIVEADNLKRDFTFNLKITRPNHTIRIEKGEIISAVIPLKRYVADGFNIKHGIDVLGSEYDSHIKEQSRLFGDERSAVDAHKPHGIGRRYYNGEDASSCPFHDHQTKIKRK